MKTKCKVCTVMCDISRGNELRACAFEHNGDENICPFDARYLDLQEHDKQVRADAIDEYKEQLLENLIPLKDKYFALAKGTKMPEGYTHLRIMDTTDMIIEMVKIKAEQLKE